MKAYVQPDFEVMTFAANEYISLCYDLGAGSGDAGVSCHATGPSHGSTTEDVNKYFYAITGVDSNGNITGYTPIDDIVSDNLCNSETTDNPNGATNYDCWATNLQQVSYSGTKYWANAFYTTTDQVTETTHKNWIVRFFDRIWHFCDSGTFRPNGNINQDPINWSNHS